LAPIIWNHLNFQEQVNPSFKWGKKAGGDGGPLIPTYKVHPPKIQPQSNYEMGRAKIEDLVCIRRENNSNQNNGESKISKT
jgi:hypothetical protein